MLVCRDWYHRRTVNSPMTPDGEVEPKAAAMGSTWASRNRLRLVLYAGLSRVRAVAPFTDPSARWCGTRDWLKQSVTGTRFGFRLLIQTLCFASVSTCFGKLRLRHVLLRYRQPSPARRRHHKPPPLQPQPRCRRSRRRYSRVGLHPLPLPHSQAQRSRELSGLPLQSILHGEEVP